MPELDLDHLYDAHASAVFAFAMTLMRAEAEARDILQEVFVKFARHPPAAPLHDPRGYLLRMAHTRFIDRRRQEAAAGRMRQRLSEEKTSLFAPADDPDTRLFREALESALAELPADQRAVVHLKLWEGRTFEDIATLLDIPFHTATSRYRYGLGKLRARLLDLYQEIRHLPQP